MSLLADILIYGDNKLNIYFEQKSLHVHLHHQKEEENKSGWKRNQHKLYAQKKKIVFSLKVSFRLKKIKKKTRKIRFAQ